MTDATIEPVIIPIKINTAKARPSAPKKRLTGPRRFPAKKILSLLLQKANRPVPIDSLGGSDFRLDFPWCRGGMPTRQPNIRSLL